MKYFLQGFLIILIIFALAIPISSHAVDLKIQEDKQVAELTKLCGENNGKFSKWSDDLPFTSVGMCTIPLFAGDEIPDFIGESKYRFSLSYSVSGMVDSNELTDEEKIIERLDRIIELLEAQQSDIEGEN